MFFVQCETYTVHSLMTVAAFVFLHFLTLFTVLIGRLRGDHTTLILRLSQHTSSIYKLTIPHRTMLWWCVGGFWILSEKPAKLTLYSFHWYTFDISRPTVVKNINCCLLNFNHFEYNVNKPRKWQNNSRTTDYKAYNMLFSHVLESLVRDV